MESYSKYLEYPEIQEALENTVERGWIANVLKAKNYVRRGKEMADQINILGDDGVPMSYHEAYWKSELIDFAFLQQDAFDPIDSVCPMERQKYMLDLILGICDKTYNFEDYEQCRAWFKELINILRQMNYSEFGSADFEKYSNLLTQKFSENGD